MISNSKLKLLLLLVLKLFVSETYSHVCTIESVKRIDCYPEDTAKLQKLCEARGCCFDFHAHVNDDVPWCFYPLDYPSYQVDHIGPTKYGFSGTLSINSSHMDHFGPAISNVVLDIFVESENRLRFRLTDQFKARYEVPILTPSTTDASQQTLYDVHVEHERFGVVITRKSSGTVVFNSTFAPLIYSNQFLQISTILPSSNIYGLGERHEGLLVDTNWKRSVFWAHDGVPSPGVNLYGDHPVYFCIENDGNAHGVFFLNSNAKEAIIQPAPALTWRSIGGIFDFYVFLGPTPEMVFQQYTDVIGKTFLPPLWSLGFHLCRYGYNSSETTQMMVNKMRAASIPQDVQWNDIDYMQDYLDFTYNNNSYGTLPQLVDDLHSNGQHYVMIIDPGISNKQPKGSYPAYDDGISSGLFVMNPEGSVPIEGTVWPGTVSYPDFTHPSTSAYWEKQLSAYHSRIPFDGVWIDMNEPSNFVHGSTSGCPNNSLEHPPYTPRIIGGSLSEKTICSSSRQYNNSFHYDVHSLTGLFEMKATSEALIQIRNKRPFVILRSTYPSAGKYGGHWSGDIVSTWADLKQSISSIINFNMFGIPMVGADICGFGGDTTEELCIRWTQLGAFYPFSRNHNSLHSTGQAPVEFSEEAQAIMRSTLKVRYYYLPYLYSLFFSSHVTGSTVARGLFSEFPLDKNALAVDRQFLLGRGLLISPVVEQGVSLLTAYFPSGSWYFVFGPFGKKIISTGESINLDVTLSDLVIHARGGSIFPTQKPATTTTLTRANPMTLIVAPDQMGNARGFLFWDDGESLDTYEKKKYLNVEFNLINGTLTSNVVNDDGENHVILDDVYLFDASPDVTSVSVNGHQISFERRQYNVIHFNCSLSLSKSFKIIIK